MSVTLKDMAQGGRIRFYLALVGLVLMLGMFLLASPALVKAQSTPGYHDGDNPSAAYVLGKLNEHLIAAAKDQTSLQEVDTRLKKVEDVGERIDRVESNQSLQFKMLTSLLVGVVTIICKEFLSHIDFK